MAGSTLKKDDPISIFPLETVVSRTFSFRVHPALVDGMLIDTGFRHARARLWRALAGRTVLQAVNTHAHEDHSGNNQVLRERQAVQLFAPAAALRALAAPWVDTRHFYQRVIWGLPEPSSPGPLDAVLRTERFAFQVILTPGHSKDHICLFEGNRGWLFTGDLFLGTKIRVARPYENGADLITSLERVLELKPRLMICYHRSLIRDPPAALGRKLDWLYKVRDQTHQLHSQGESPERIAQTLLGPDPRLLAFLTSGDVSNTNLIRSLLKEAGQGYEY